MPRSRNPQPPEPADEFNADNRWRGLPVEQLRDQLDVLDAELRVLHADEYGEPRGLNPEQTRRFDRLLLEREAGRHRLEQHARISAELARGGQVERAFGTLAQVGTTNPFDGSDALALTAEQARSRALGALEERGQHLRSDQADQVDRLLRQRITDDTPSFDGSVLARRILLTESDAYRSAWRQVMTDPRPLLTGEEVEALRAFRSLERTESRAMSEGVTTAGGFGVPVFIDPSIILTAQGSANPFRQLARWVPVTSSRWKGVNSVGMSWSFDAEGTAVSDDSPTIAQPEIAVNMARGFIPFSIEIGQDYPAFADEMAQLLASGYDELLVDKLTRGSGVGEPQGVVTALDANPAAEILLTTAGSFGEVDLYAAWAAVPQRFRMRAAWLMGVGVNNAIRRFAGANVVHAFTANLREGAANQLFGREVFEDPYLADFTTTTGHQNVLVVGDFSGFVVAERAGLSVELVPTLFDQTTNRPTGQRGWFAYARAGSGVVNPGALRLLNQT